MSDFAEVLKAVGELRLKLDTMTENRSLTDPQAMYASRMLDGVLCEYQEIMKDKFDRS